mmetsp:Transcript_3381/g.7931  ORF Transcript_3381/g.7931 Transcript_3381/m.7931 type:complete len:271 (-) Transcript_3381:156-968(-)
MRPPLTKSLMTPTPTKKAPRSIIATGPKASETVLPYLRYSLNCSRSLSMSPLMSNSSDGMAMRTTLDGFTWSGAAIPGVPKLRCHSTLPASLLDSHSPSERSLRTDMAFMEDSWSVMSANISMHSPEGLPPRSRMYSNTSMAGSHSRSSTRRLMSATNQLDVSTSLLRSPCSMPCARTHSTTSRASAHCRVRPMPTSTDLYPSKHMSSFTFISSAAAGMPRLWFCSSCSITCESMFSSRGLAPTLNPPPSARAARLNASVSSSLAFFQSA